MHKLLLLLLLGAAITSAQELITEADTIWMREYGYVTDVNFSPDGTRLVVTEPGAYYVYDSFTGEELLKVYEGSNKYNRSIITSDNKYVVTIRTRKIIVHNIETDEIFNLTHNGEVLDSDLNHIVYNPNNNILYTLLC